MVFQAGQEIGNYRIVGEIAQGAYAYVYKATHTALAHRIVAIKVLHKTFVDPEAKHDILYQEAQVLEQLQHPHILAVLDFGSYENAPYIVKEYAPHGSLRDLLRRQRNRPLPINDALFLLRQIGEGLQFAHDHNIVHCDLKPENILFNAENQALISDFDIARVLKATNVQGRNIGGTPSYMAPEQFHGKVRRESDQYALACMAYEMLTGRRTFEGENLATLQQLHLHEQPLPPRQLRGDLPLHIEQALLRALDKDYQQRYPSVTAFVEALDPPLSGEWPTAVLTQQGGARLVLHAPGKHQQEDEDIFYEETISMHAEATLAESDIPTPRKRRTATAKPASGESVRRRSAGTAPARTAKPRVSRAKVTEKDTPRPKATTKKTTTAKEAVKAPAVKKATVKKTKASETAGTMTTKPKTVRTKAAAEKKPAAIKKLPVAKKPAARKSSEVAEQSPVTPRSLPAWQQAMAHRQVRSTGKDK